MKPFRSRNSRLAPVLIALVCITLLPAAPVRAAQPGTAGQGGLTSPQKLLNSDGTLKLDGRFSGALDLHGWSVQLDPARGPVFGLLGGGPSGQWSSLGGGLQALDHEVYALTVNGADVYVGGSFTNADGIPAADFIAKWDGTNWSALSNNGAGDGSLNSLVKAITVSGSDVYVGGAFTNVNNQGTVLDAADYIARWDGSNWNALGSGVAGEGSLNDWVTAIALDGSTLYAGGLFVDVRNNGTILGPADYVARWDGTNWSALGYGSAGNGSLNHYVNALALVGTDLYVGGTFWDVNNHGTVLTAADYIARWNGADWSALHSDGAGEGALNGEVDAMAVSGTDLYVGGAFHDVHDGILPLPSADGIARWDGSLWYALGTGAGNGSLNNRVTAIAASGSTVYVGGDFTNVNNYGTTLLAADYIAKFDGTNWSAIGSNGLSDGALNDTVRAIALSGTDVYVGGGFTDVNNNGAPLSAANYIATWDGTNWSAPAAITPSGALRNEVYAVAVLGTDVYVGGNFTNVANGAEALTAADYIARWDGTNWNAVGSDGMGDGSLNAFVDALAVSGTDLYVGGDFNNVNDNGTPLDAADKIARWDGSHWSALGQNGIGSGSLNDLVYAIAVSGSNIYVGGYFTDVNNKGTSLTSADYVARWDGTDWFPLGNNGQSNGSLNHSVRALAVSGTDLYVGGNFYDVSDGGTPLPAADYVAHWDGTHWNALGQSSSGEGSLNSSVYALVVSGADVYVGGSFTDVDDNGAILNAADSVARWDGTHWYALGSNGADGGALPAGAIVYALGVDGTDLYVGGDFSDVSDNGTPIDAADFIARWDGTRWSALGSGAAGDGSLNGTVRSIAGNSTQVYVGGLFVDVNNNGTLLTAGDRIATYRAEVCQPVQEASITGPVALQVSQTGLYTASYAPLTATLPVTFTWDNGTAGANAAYSWPIPGTYTLIVTVTGPCSTVTGTLQVEVTAEPLTYRVYLPVLRKGTN